MKRSWWMTMAVIALASLIMSACGTAAPSAPSAPPVRLTMSTSAQGSSNYPLSVALTEVWNKTVPGLSADLGPGGGTAAVIATEKNDAQMGMTLSTAAVDGRAGKPPFDGKTDKVVSLATLDPQANQYFAYKQSGITRFEQLKGKRVWVAPKSFASHAVNILVTESHGMSFNDFAKAEAIAKPEGISQLKDGHLDALLWNGPVPDGNLIDASMNRPITFIEMSDAAKTKIRQANPGIVLHTVKKGIYPGVDKDYESLSVPRILVIRTSVAEAVVYGMVKAMHEKWNDLVTTDPGLKSIEPKDMAMSTGIPFHPGALKYFKEKGWAK